MITRTRIPARPVPETDWRPLPVQVFVRADEDGHATHLRFRLENGDDHVAPVRPENVALRALAEELLRTTPPRGRCSRWFG